MPKIRPAKVGGRADRSYLLRREVEQAFLARRGLGHVEGVIHEQMLAMRGHGEHDARKILCDHHRISRAVVVAHALGATEASLDPSVALRLAQSKGLSSEDPLRAHMLAVLVEKLGDADHSVRVESELHAACADEQGGHLNRLTYRSAAVRLQEALEGNQELAQLLLSAKVSPAASSQVLWPGQVRAMEHNVTSLEDVTRNRERSQLACRKCGCFTVQFVEKQCRSADEPMTVFWSCLTCNQRGRF